jgi:peroxiredoxin
MKTKLFLTLGLILVLTSAAYSQTVETRKAPDFALPNVEGKIVSLSKSLGQGPIYISFWATWCKPCLEEMKIIQKIYEKYEDQGFRVMAINTEGPKASAKVKSFIKSYGFTFDILLDNDGEVFRRKFKGAAMPYTFLVNADGKIVFSAVGFKPGDEIEIEKLIVANLPAAPDSTGQSGSEE